MIIKVVADTNVYISALNFRGVPNEILTLAKKKSVSLFIPAFIIEEIEGVLIDKFGWSGSQAKKAIAHIKKFSNLVDCKEKIDDAILDKADNRILECACEARADFIVSGDSHLTNLKIFRNIKIVSPAEFLKMLV